MSKRTILSQNTSLLISSLLNLDVYALQTTKDICTMSNQYGNYVRHKSKINSAAFNHSENQGKEPQSSLYHCIERLFNCLSEEAQRAISQGIKTNTPDLKEIER